MSLGPRKKEFRVCSAGCKDSEGNGVQAYARTYCRKCYQRMWAKGSIPKREGPKYTRWLNVSVTEAVDVSIGRISRATGRTRADVVRDALDEMLARWSRG